jgi:predicted RNA binding protein YcfA (HicA-like mRNA interferase family)
MRITYCHQRIYAHSVRIKARDIIKAIKTDGWPEARSTGGHQHFKHPTKPGVVMVPMHGSSDVKLAVVKSIEKQSGVKLRQERTWHYIITGHFWSRTRAMAPMLTTAWCSPIFRAAPAPAARRWKRRSMPPMPWVAMSR